jgi:hypothetical protein
MYPLEKYNFRTFETINEDGSKTTNVIALSTFAGKAVKGTAKCMESDEFSLEAGKKLAAARCDAKVCNKRVRRARKKLLEVSKKIDGLEELHRKMFQYYNDALEEAINSIKRLDEIQQSMS